MSDKNRISNIRNFSIIAHIDHGKSTLADRLIEICGGLDEREMVNCVLDSMDIERERNITIKAQAVSLRYRAKNNITYTLNLIDTPGHVDFGYEVKRSLAACEGSILVVDSTQGVEAQTLANVYKAIENNHRIIIALNKIDLPATDVAATKQQIHDMIGLDTDDAIGISAKTGYGVIDLLESVVKLLPPPSGDETAPLKAMLVDSWYDKYLGIVILVRVFDGVLKHGMQIRMMSNNKIYNVESIGIFTPKKVCVDELVAGDVGFITASIRQVADCNVGDTITDHKSPCQEALPGFQVSQPVVFCGFYPDEDTLFEDLKSAVTKLHLNDASFHYTVESSKALGFGMRCGFLGLLHLDIIKERLLREYGVHVITTSPSVMYRVKLSSGDTIEVHDPASLPDPTRVEYIEEPWVRVTIFVPDEFLGSVLALCTDRRGKQVEMMYTENRIMLVYDLPLNEIVYDFHDDLKSCSSGYASCDWEMHEYAIGDIVKLNILINGDVVDALSMMVYRGNAASRGRVLCATLKKLIPRHMFAIPIQAAIGGKIIARETISALRKDVTAKCYGGDITRKKKLLEKQKEGKKRLKSTSNVHIPSNVFTEVLKAKKESVDD